MISRFPAPWQIVELPNGFAVEDATGKQIGVFYGRAPCSAGHTGIMTIDEARQMAIDLRSCRNCSSRTGDEMPTQWHHERQEEPKERRERRARIKVTVLDVLIGLALAVLVAIVLKMIFY